jgi:broad specificity phosphatase PhoE
MKKWMKQSSDRVSHALSDALARTSVGTTSTSEQTTTTDAFGEKMHVPNLNNGFVDDSDDTHERGVTFGGSARSTAKGLLKRLGGASSSSSRRANNSNKDGIDDAYYEGVDDVPVENNGQTTYVTVTRGDFGASASPNGRYFVAVRCVGGDGALKGRRITTLCRSKTRTPVWNATRDLRCRAEAYDSLRVDVFSGASVKGVHKATLVASGQVSLRNAISGGGREEIAVPVYAKLARLTSPGAVYLRVDASGIAAPKLTKRIFFVRHGESKWNEAQRDINIASMIKFDHPLTLAGVQQAQALGGRAAVAISHADAGVLVHANVMSLSPPTMSPPSSPSSPIRRTCSGEVNGSDQTVNDGAELCVSYENCFTCYVSPLTRAVQTACLLLQNHPRRMQGVLKQVCLQSLREVKGVGGLDTVGIAQGENVLVRAREKLAEIVNPQAASRLGEGIAFDPNDAVGQWWTSETDSDSSQEVEERIYDFLETMRFDEHDAVIVVGHSLFLQQLVSRIAPGNSDERSTQTVSEAVSITSMNPFDTFTSQAPPSDPFATFSAPTGQGDVNFTPFVPSMPPTAERIEEKRDKAKIFDKLIKSKICNAGCVALDISFDEKGRVTLENASLLFGSKFL